MLRVVLIQLWSIGIKAHTFLKQHWSHTEHWTSFTLKCATVPHSSDVLKNLATKAGRGSGYKNNVAAPCLSHFQQVISPLDCENGIFIFILQRALCFACFFTFRRAKYQAWLEVYNSKLIHLMQKCKSIQGRILTLKANLFLHDLPNTQQTLLVLLLSLYLKSPFSSVAWIMRVCNDKHLHLLAT